MPPPLGSLSTLFATTAKPFAAKSIGPISSTVLRQQQPPYSTTSTVKKPSVVTESAVLNSFPRPNLQPTLHSSPSMFDLQVLKALNPIQTCFNCNGPHSTEFCPC
ncbi:hypothetical protein MAM1_0552d10896 [Mucor ambiguus]|uniref:Uncharacterized protein n=1 Tax=Mucor ambiguus TaxID=91626 RepID=A0A0C9N5K4_9FUNG|nr:hypothetical protein MAM1_0552d10896 [Mucor ambiguus]